MVCGQRHEPLHNERGRLGQRHPEPCQTGRHDRAPAPLALKRSSYRSATSQFVAHLIMRGRCACKTPCDCRSAPRATR